QREGVEDRQEDHRPDADRHAYEADELGNDDDGENRQVKNERGAKRPAAASSHEKTPSVAPAVVHSRTLAPTIRPASGHNAGKITLRIELFSRRRVAPRATLGRTRPAGRDRGCRRQVLTC